MVVLPVVHVDATQAMSRRVMDVLAPDGDTIPMPHAIIALASCLVAIGEGQGDIGKVRAAFDRVFDNMRAQSEGRAGSGGLAT